MLSKIFESIETENKYCYLLGDFNVNLLNAEKHPPTNDFCDNMFPNYHVLLITKPTRIPSDSSTLIDNIFTNKFDSDHFHGILITDISDHYPIFCVHTKVQITYSNDEIPKRNFCDKNINHFIQNLQTIN